MSAYLSFNHYDLLSPPRWVGLANYRYLFNVDPQIWTAVKNTLWLIAIARAAAGAVRVRHRAACSRAPARACGVFRTIFYLPALAPPVAATLGFVYILNPATGPVNTILGAPRHPGAAVVPGPGLVEAVARRARRSGASATR